MTTDRMFSSVLQYLERLQILGDQESTVGCNDTFCQDRCRAPYPPALASVLCLTCGRTIGTQEPGIVRFQVLSHKPLLHSLQVHHLLGQGRRGKEWTSRSLTSNSPIPCGDRVAR